MRLPTRAPATSSLFLVLAVAAGFGLPLGACGDDASGGDATGDATSGRDGATPSDDFRTRIARAQCEYNVRCAQIPAQRLGVCQDNAARMGAERLDTIDEKSAIAAGRLEVDLAKVDACVASLAATGCSTDEVGKAFEPCNAVLKGKVAEGAECFFDRECATGFCTAPSNGTTCPGVCKAFQADGETCTISGAERCARSSFCADRCDGDGCTDVCVAQGDVGDPCDGSPSQPCRYDLVCEGVVPASGGVPAAPGTCSVVPGLGEPCSTDFFGCQPGLVCDRAATPPTCVARRPAGGPCGNSNDCADGLLCDGAVAAFGQPATVLGACKVAIQTGESCTPPVENGSSACVNFSVCDPSSKVCVERSGVAGDDCGPSGTKGQCTFLSYCDAASKKCQPLIASGEACAEVSGGAESSSCWEYACNDGTCGRTCP